MEGEQTPENIQRGEEMLTFTEQDLSIARAKFLKELEKTGLELRSPEDFNCVEENEQITQISGIFGIKSRHLVFLEKRGFNNKSKIEGLVIDDRIAEQLFEALLPVAEAFRAYQKLLAVGTERVRDEVREEAVEEKLKDSGLLSLLAKGIK